MKNLRVIASLVLGFTLMTSNVAFSAPKAKSVKKQSTQVAKVNIQVEQTVLNSIDKMIENGQYVKAEIELNNQLKKQPNNIDLKILKTVLLAKQKKIELAQQNIDSMINKYPKKANLHYAQGLVDVAKTTSSNMDYRKNREYLLNSAKEDFKTAIMINPKHYAAYNALGVCELKQNNVLKAKEYFEKSFKLAPNAAAIDNLGTIDLLDNKLNDAEDKFLKALSYNPNSATANFHLAQLCDIKKDYSKALYYLDKSIALNHKSTAAYNLLGEIYHKQGNDAAAIEAFKKSMALKPENSKPYMNLANIYEKRGDFEFAVAELKTAVSVNPHNYEARLKVADISFATSNYNQALKYYASLLDVPSYDKEALKGMSNTYFELAKYASAKNVIGSTQNFAKALRYIDKAIASDSNNLELYLAKVKLMNVANRPYEQAMVLNHIVVLPIKSVNDMITKGEAYFALDDFKRADAMFDMAVNSTKNLKEDLLVAEILTYHKHYDSARKSLQKALFRDPYNKVAKSNLDYIVKTENRSNAILKDANKLYDDKQYVLAREYAVRALNYNPANKEAVLLLANTCEKEKNYEDAVSNYQKYSNFNLKKRYAKRVQKKIDKLEKKIK